MKKMTTLFNIHYSNNGKTREITQEVRPENAWVYTEEGILPTRKFDGSACAIIDGELYKRLDCKFNKETGEYKRPIPEEAIPCQDPDIVTGHHPHWIRCDRSNKADKYFFEGYDNLENKLDGTYELCGPKVNKNREQFTTHTLVTHGNHILDIEDFSFDSIKEYLESHDIEGIVFHGRGGKMCKIRKVDYGIKR